LILLFVCLFVVVLLRVVARVLTVGGKNECWWCLHAGNAATQFFLPLAIIAAVVGLASILAGIYHLRVYRTDSLSAAHASALIAWLLILLGMGLAAKEIHVGGYRSKKLKTLEAFTIILSFFQLLYLLSLHSGILGPKYGPTYNNNNNGVGPKSGDYGTPVATAV
jgi:hypothetical protein